MPNKILKRTSFGLLRTNPRLTTNIKIVADSSDKIYLESIDADPLLSKSIYKGFKVSYNGSYSFDLKRFYSQNGTLLPKEIAYKVFEEDSSIEIKNRYKNQYDFTYGVGFYPKNSRIYPEEFAIFSPLWIEKDNIPERFVIFKMDGPVTVNPNSALPGYPSGYTGDFDDAPFLNELIEDPNRFFENYIQKAKIIKSFDLKETSALGTYIRNHVNDPNFPESSLYASLEKGNNTYWNGISYSSGGFCSIGREIYSDYTLVDKTVTELDDKITTGFRDASVICANLLNLEFLFDDPDQELYKFSRYFGLYMSEVELGKFILDSERLYADKDAEFSQNPQPLNKIQFGSPTNINSNKQTNYRGIKIYPKIGPSGPYSGRLIQFSETQNPRLGYVKDRNEKLYSLDNVTDWKTITMQTGPTGNYPVVDSDYLRIKNNSVDWRDFSGFNEPFDYITALKTNKKGRPSISFKIISQPSNGDEIRVRFTDWTNPNEAPYVDTHTIKASNSISAGTVNGLTFSTNGTLKEIAKSISLAINNIEKYSAEYEIFSSLSINNEVIIFSRVTSENWNKLKISLFSDSSNFPFDISNQLEDVISTNSYIPSPISTSAPILGFIVNSPFSGGNDNPGSRAIIEQDKITELRIGNSNDPVYVKTDKGYFRISNYGLYLEEEVKNSIGEIVDFKNIEKYFVINLENLSANFEFGSSNKIALYDLSKNSCGWLSILPIRDFDFDFESTDYAKDADSNVEKLYDWYKGQTGPNGELPLFSYSSLSPTGANYIDSIVGPTSPFAINGGFQRLIGYTDLFTDVLEKPINEYDRLKENYLAQIALSSRVVPFINKWVYDNEGVDVRENGYRLSSNPTFGYSNFSPSFDEIPRNTKFFTHEWYYLQKYPPYMNFEERVRSFSYFDEDIYFPQIPNPGSSGSTAIYASLISATGASANLLSIEEDYFLSYFTRESVNGFPIERDFKYSLFSLGDPNRGAETMFRGAKVEIKDRSEFSPINYNKESLRYIYNQKYNGYRFSAVLTYGNAGTQLTCIKNDKYKAVTLIIQSDLDDIITSYIPGTGATANFIDRSLLYCATDRLGPSGSDIGISDVSISGLISDWSDETSYFDVKLTQDNFGNFPNLSNEISLNSNGSYNNIRVTDGTFTYEFIDVFDVTQNSFKCFSINGIPLQNPLIPNGTRSFDNAIANSPLYFPLYLEKNPFNFNPIYIDGGFNYFSTSLEAISFSNLASSINLGDPEIRYINVTPSGEIQFNTFVIDLLRPDYPFTSEYLKREILEKTSSDLQVDSPILGYKLGALDRLILNQVSRYRGAFNPKWRNIIKFVDTADLVNEELSYYNIQILTDLGYFKDNNLGQIPYLYFNKVNVENPNIILSNPSARALNSDRFIYPLIGDVAIDFDNFFIFKSNWDAEYYKKYLAKKKRVPVIGTREPKEEKSFFGSKAISIPNEVRIETFPSGTITQDELTILGSINNTSANLVQSTITKQRSTELTVEVFVTKALQDWLIAEGISSEFIKYINPNFSFGNVGLDDDIKTYISENIFDRYSIKEIILWEKVWNLKKGEIGPDQVVTNLTDSQKSLNGYTQSKSFRTVFKTTGGLDFNLIYTIPRDKRTSIAFTVILEKK